METVENKQCCRSWLTAVVAVISCLIFVALVLVMKNYTLPAPAIDEARKAERAKALVELRAAEADALNTPGWVDQPRGIVRIPIAEALKLAQAEWQNPAKARADLLARAEKAAAPLPKSPEKPSAFE